MPHTGTSDTASSAQSLDQGRVAARIQTILTASKDSVLRQYTLDELLQGYWRIFSQVSADVLQGESQENPLKNGAIDRAFEAYLEGISRYQNYTLSETKTGQATDLGGETVWQLGTSRLVYYAPPKRCKNGRPILMIPSLINGAKILDICDNWSLARGMAAYGHDTYVLSWGSPEEAEQDFGLEEYAIQRLIPATEWIQKTHDGAVGVLGYCLGGMLALATAQIRPDLISHLALVATPWDFRHQAPSTRLLAHLAQKELQSIGTQKLIAGENIRRLFRLLTPDGSVAKFSHFSSAAREVYTVTSLQADIRGRLTRFVAVEDWANNCPPLTQKVARDILEWYQTNAPYNGQWHMAGHKIIAQADVPTLVCSGLKDSLVPLASTEPLLGGTHLQKPPIENLTVDSGHVGVIVSNAARLNIWPRLNTFFAS